MAGKFIATSRRSEKAKKYREGVCKYSDVRYLLRNENNQETHSLLLNANAGMYVPLSF